MADENEVEFEEADELRDWLVANHVSQSMAEKAAPSLYNVGFISSSTLIGIYPDVLANYVDPPVAQYLSNKLKPERMGKSLAPSSTDISRDLSRDREHVTQLQKLEKGELEGRATWDTNDDEDEIPIAPMTVRIASSKDATRQVASLPLDTRRSVQPTSTLLAKTMPPMVSKTTAPVVSKTTITKSYAAPSTTPQSTNIITEATPVDTAPGAPPEQSFASQPASPPTMSYAASGCPIQMGHKPERITCQYCQAKVLTRTYDRIGTFALIMLIVLLLLFWPLFWLPLVLSGCKDKDHICPNCNRKVGEAQADCDSC